MAKLPHYPPGLRTDINPIRTYNIDANIESGDEELDNAINFYIKGMSENSIIFNINQHKGNIVPLNDLLKLGKFNICVEIELNEKKHYIYYKGCVFNKKELISSFINYDYDDEIIIKTETYFDFDDIDYLRSDVELKKYIRKNKLDRIIK